MAGKAKQYGKKRESWAGSFQAKEPSPVLYTAEKKKARKGRFVFSSALFKEDNGYSVLCLDLDVASEGRTPENAKKNLAEAVDLYLETAIESNMPYLRPVPASEDPRKTKIANCRELFDIRADFSIRSHA